MPTSTPFLCLLFVTLEGNSAISCIKLAEVIEEAKLIRKIKPKDQCENYQCTDKRNLKSFFT